MSRKSDALSLLHRAVLPVEKAVKESLFDCKLCGQCLLSHTGFVCPMGCPKGLRNGPCGGMTDGRCEVYPDRPCVWVRIYERRHGDPTGSPPPLHAPVDTSLVGTSSYVNLLLGKDRRTRQPLEYPSSVADHRTDQANPLAERLRRGAFTMTCEVRTPRSPAGLRRLHRELAAVARIADGVNATSHPEDPSFSFSPLDTTQLILEYGGVPVQQVCGRDVKAEELVDQLESGWRQGNRNILMLTGDWRHTLTPAEREKDPWKYYFGMDAAQMIYEADALRRGLDSPFTGRTFAEDRAPAFFVGGVINPYTRPHGVVLSRLAQKIACGLNFVQTQMVLDVQGLALWIEQLRLGGLLGRFYLLPTVPVILSAKALELYEGLPGVHLPPEIAASLTKRAEELGDFAPAGLELAAQTCRRLRQVEGVNGVHLAVFGGDWSRIAPWLVEIKRELGDFRDERITAVPADHGVF